MSRATTIETPVFAITKTRTKFFGLSMDECIRAFFGGNALVAVAVLALITFALFREGLDFFSLQRSRNLTAYRQAGLEYVDFAKREEADHTALTRYLSDVRLQALMHLTKEQKLSIADANKQLASFDDFAGKYSDAIDPVRSIVSDWTEYASGLKAQFFADAEKKAEAGTSAAPTESADANVSAAKPVPAVDLGVALKPLLDGLAPFKEANKTFTAQLEAALQAIPTMPTAKLQQRMRHFADLTHEYEKSFPAVEQKLQSWDYRRPIPFYKSITSFLFGTEWITASFWQDWYGILPLLVGSLMVSAVALVIAVPFGVGAAIYVNQIANPKEAAVIKPAIEFISAFPSVVLGFFGIAVFGETLRHLSQQSWLQWVPGFPIAERLNVLTAGGLLALMAIPTIFTLAEDALNNVPRSFKEASFALGANRIQTIAKITVPASLSGIVSAVLLGLGRVIGETMVVLLCAGNRIAIPDFSAGLGAFTQPVHTMTGIIAQEMGEVVRGSLHYRALFVVGILLFFLSLLINYVAQTIVRRYRIAGT
ncbi:MAG TPA: phosphate ABC transporter permease subunit PstC [Opitutaceae bacterium]|nr:phosphate ABC transporter permease subunit PstC [Opitutaceae bacterium]